MFIEFDINQSNNSVLASIAGDALPYINLADYTYQWYYLDITGQNTTLLEGETTTQLDNLEEGTEYKIIAFNNSNEILTVEGSFIYGDRTVIYVDYNNGSDYNDGYTPETAVMSLQTGYRKLDSSGTLNSNIIVLMGEYSDTNFLSSSTSTTYSKNASITGLYNGTNYNGILAFEGESDYRYATADIGFHYITLNGEYESWFSTRDGSVYFYLQGHSLTMGDGVVMQNYTTANTNQGLITGNAPAFHVICGWLRYNYATLPRNNPEILIKSGTYGRIILGGSPGTNAVSNLNQTTSRNFTGSSYGDMFNITVTIDIQNSTTPEDYAYDINLLVGGAACGNTYANVTENIKSGNIGRVLGASIGDTSNRPNNWNYPINTFLGYSNINISGGNITELYGGCLGRNMSALTGGSDLICDSYFYGDININISGGIVSSNIYGAGAGGVTGYSINSSDEFKSYGENINTNVNINISGGTINGNIYGGGYGYTEYLTASVTAIDGGSLYGNSNIVISGGTINGNIYGAGCGSDNVNNRDALAVCEGTTNITVEGSPIINGSIYGSGMGISNMENMAKLTGTSNIYINTNTNVNIYGGGNIAKTIGSTNVTINSRQS